MPFSQRSRRFSTRIRKRVSIHAGSVFALCLAVLLPALAGEADDERFRLPPPMRSFEAGMLHVDRYGTGEPAVVIVPGLACGPWAFAEVITHLAGRHAVYALTLPGFDGRPATGRRPLLYGAVSDLGQMLAREGLVRPIIVGHSLGGTLALAAGERLGDEVGGVVSIDGPPVDPALAGVSEQQRIVDAAAARSAFEYSGRNADPTIQAYSTMTVGPVDFAIGRRLRFDREAMSAWTYDLTATDLRSELPTLRAPVLFVVPFDPAEHARDHADLAEVAEAYKRLLDGTPHLSVVTLSPARHFAMLDRPVEFARALDDFIEAVSATPAAEGASAAPKPR